MHIKGEEFKVLIYNSRNLVETLRLEEQEISPMQRARLMFQLRLAYNLTLKQCPDQRLVRELKGIIQECEGLLSS
ncbi:MAG: hypothetical protein AB1441_03380 [Bacillota bacterium]